MATVTFKEERFPCIGILSTKSDFSIRILLIPSPSFPIKITSSFRSGSLDQSSVPRSLVETIQYPFSFKSSKVLARFLTVKIFKNESAPDATFSTTGVIPADSLSGRMMFVTPKHSAVLSIFPKFPGSWIRSKIKKAPGFSERNSSRFFCRM